MNSYGRDGAWPAETHLIRFQLENLVRSTSDDDHERSRDEQKILGWYLEELHVVYDPRDLPLPQHLVSDSQLRLFAFPVQSLTYFPCIDVAASQYGRGRGMCLPQRTSSAQMVKRSVDVGLSFAFCFLGLLTFCDASLVEFIYVVVSLYESEHCAIFAISATCS